MQDYPIEQYVRDAKIDTLYEGTTAIQGMDLFFRKIVKDGGKALGHLNNEIEAFLNDPEANEQLKVERDLLRQGLADTQEILGLMFNDLMSANVADGGDIKNVYKVGLNTTRMLFVLGDIVCAWLLLRGAEVALRNMESKPEDKAFYEGKVAAASFFAKNVLPKIAAEKEIAKSVDLELMNLDEAAF